MELDLYDAVCELDNTHEPGVQTMAPRTSRSALAPRSKLLVCKRVLDVVVSTGLFITLLPLMVLIALAIKFTSRGRIIYSQQRVGLNGREFRFYKFRSMVQNAEILRDRLNVHNQHGSNGVTFKLKNDPRITSVGRVLRRTSLDELPQLWNVLVGDMSLVGPRPALPSEVARYTEFERRRLGVKPGITCFWQVAGRANIPFREQVRLDLQYIEQCSLWLDVKLLVRTITAVFSGNGAY